MTKELVLQSIEHTQSKVSTHSIIVSYIDVQDKEIKQNKLKDTQSPQLISALDKDSQPMGIALIQPPKAGDMLNENIIEFKFNMGQFSVVDKVDLFNQTRELICSNLISTYVSKDKLQRYLKRLENKLKTKSAEKKALLIEKRKSKKPVKKRGKRL